MAGRTRIQTAPRTGQTFQSSEIQGFLSSIEDGGGRQDFTIHGNTLSDESIPDGSISLYTFGETSSVSTGYATSNPNGSFALVNGTSYPSDDTFVIGLDVYELWYVDQENFAVVEVGAQQINQTSRNIAFWTRYVAASGRFRIGETVSKYTSVSTGGFPGAINSSTGTQFETISGTNYYGLIRDGGAVNYLLFPQGIGDRTWAVGDDVSFRLPSGDVYSGLTVSTIRAEGSESRFDSGSGDAVRVDFDQAMVDAIQAQYASSGDTWFVDPDDIWFENIQIFNGATFPAESGINVEDFIDFYSINTPERTPVIQVPQTIEGQDFVASIFIGANAAGVVTGSGDGDFGVLASFNGGSDVNTISIGDVIDIQLYESDKTTEEPSFSLTKQVIVDQDTEFVVGDGVLPPEEVVVLTQSVIQFARDHGSETVAFGDNEVWSFTEDQVSIQVSSQPQVIAPNQQVSDSFTIEPSNEVNITSSIKVLDNKNIGGLYGDISPSFEIPLTNEIKREFNYPDDVAGQIIPGVANSIDIILDTDEETIGVGSLSVTEWDQTSMQVRYQSGIPSLADSLGEKLMSGVDLTNEDLVARGLVDDTGLSTGLWADLEFPYTMEHWRTVNAMADFSAGYAPVFGDFGFDPDGRPRIERNAEALALAGVATVEDNEGAIEDDYGVTTRAAVDHYEELYGSNPGSFYPQSRPNNTSGYGGRSRLVGPSDYFGEVSQGAQAQGYITHPSTPFRVEQMQYAPTLKTTLDKIALIGNYTYDFIGDNNVNILDTMLQDVLVFKKSYEGNGIIIKEDERIDEFGFDGTQARITNIKLNPGADGGTDNTYNLVASFGDRTITYSSSTDQSNLSNGEYIVPVDGYYDFNFSGIVTIGNNHLVNRRFADLDPEIHVGGERVARVDISRIHNDSPNDDEDFSWNFNFSGNLKKGQRVSAKIYMVRQKGHNSVNGDIDMTFRTVSTPLPWSGKTVNLGLQFGEETAIDTLNAIVQKFNLIVVPDKNRRNHYNFFQYYDWILSAPSNYQDEDSTGFTPRNDWSDKVDLETIQYSSLLQDQESILNFSGDESDDRISVETQESTKGRIYGSHKFSYTDSDLTAGDKTIGDNAQALAVADLSFAGDIDKAISPSPYNGIPHLYEYDGGETTSIETGIIIGYSKRIRIPNTLYYADELGTVGYNGSIRTLSNINDDQSCDLNFSNDYAYSLQTTDTAYNLYWEQYINHIYDPRNRKLTCSMFFEPHEYKTIVGNETIHLFGNDYLINEITDFPLSEPGYATVELITYQNNFTTVFTEMKNRFVEDLGEQWTTTIGLQVLPYDIVEGEEVVLPNAIKQDEYILSFIGTAETADPGDEGTDPASTETFTLNLLSNKFFDFQASSIRDNSGDLAGVTVTYEDRDDGTIDATIVVVTQALHAFYTLLIEPEVNALPTDIVNVTLNTQELQDNSITNGIVATPTLTEFGRPGTTITFRVDYSPVRGSDGTSYELLSSTFTDNTGDIDGLTRVSYTDRGTGVLGVYNYTIPETATTDFVIDPVLNPVGSSQAIGDVELSDLSVDFTEATSYSNVSLGRTPVVFPPGVVGDQFTYELRVKPDFGYYTLEGPWSSPDGIYVSAGNSIQDGDGVILEYTMTYPPIGTGTQSVVVSGVDAIPESVLAIDLVNRTITYNGSGSAHTTSEPDGSEIFSGVADVKLATGHNFTITPNEGTTFTNVSQVDVTSSSGVSNIQKVLVGGSIVLKYDVDAVSETDDPAQGHITYTVSAVAEDYTFTVNLVDNITGLTVSKRSFIWGFDQSTSARTLPEQSFTIQANENNRELTQGDIQQGPASATDDSGTVLATATLEVSSATAGVLSCNIDGVISANTAQDVVLTYPITAGTTIDGVPNLKPATMVTATPRVVTIPLAGGVETTSISSDGRWATSSPDFTLVEGTPGPGQYSVINNGTSGSISVNRPAGAEDNVGQTIIINNTSGTTRQTIVVRRSDEDLGEVATTASFLDSSNTTVAYDDPDSSFVFSIETDGAWQIGNGTGSEAIGAGTVYTSPPRGGAGVTSVTLTFEGGGGAVWTTNSLVIRPLAQNFSISTAPLLYNIYRSITTQSSYDQLQAASATPQGVRDATFYITD